MTNTIYDEFYRREKTKGLLSEAGVILSACEVLTLFRNMYALNEEVDIAPLSLAEEAQVYKIGWRGRSFVSKKHHRRVAYRRELFALNVFRHISAAPTVFWWDDASMTILMDFFGEGTVISSLDHLGLAASKLADVHVAANRYATLARHERRQVRDLEKIVEERRYANALHSIILEMSQSLGGRYIPSALGDIKEEHILLTAKQCKFCDFETFSWGRLEVCDVIDLAFQTLPDISFINKCEIVCASYCLRRSEVDHFWTTCPRQFFDWTSTIQTFAAHDGRLRIADE